MTEDTFTRRTVLNNSESQFDSRSVDGQLDEIDADRVNVGIRSDDAERQARTYSDDVDRVFDWAGDGKTISGEFSKEVLEELRDHPDVRYIEADGTMEALGQTVPWGVDRVDADRYRQRNENARPTDGADVAILDTGIDSDHPDLEGSIGEGTAFTGCEGDRKECPHDWDDDNGHGTHCAGIVTARDDDSGVVGVAPNATLHAVKVLSGGGLGRYSDIAAGIVWTANQGYDVANMSLGGGKSFLVEDAVEYAYDAGVLLVAAAGNSGPCTDCVGFPAREPEVVAVSATSEDDSLATFSSTGPQVDIAAPGEGIESTYTGGVYETLSGTSMACPHVAGAGALLMDQGESHSDARETLERSGEELHLGPNEQGYGLLDVVTALGMGNGDGGQGAGGGADGNGGGRGSNADD